MKKSEKLTVWELAIMEEALRSYDPPCLEDIAKEQYKKLIEKIALAKSVRVTF